MAKKQANGLSYRIIVYNDTGVVQRRAEIISQENGITMLRYKKPRSSKFAFKPIPTSSIVAIESGSDKGTLVSYKGRQEVARYRGMIENDKSGLLKIITDDNKTVMAHPAMVEAEADDESGAAAPKKDSGKKKKKG